MKWILLINKFAFGQSALSNFISEALICISFSYTFIIKSLFYIVTYIIKEAG